MELVSFVYIKVIKELLLFATERECREKKKTTNFPIQQRTSFCLLARTLSMRKENIYRNEKETEDDENELNSWETTFETYLTTAK